MNETPLCQEWLKPIIRTLLAAGIPLAGLASCNCPPPIDEVYLLRDFDAATGSLIEACQRKDTPQCEPLCRHVSGQTLFEHCELHMDKDGYLRLHVGFQDDCYSGSGGRRPAEVHFADNRACSFTGAILSHACQLEAASVPAFRQLAHQLRTHRAPMRLVSAARAAARDEIRHAKVMRKLANRFGAQPGEPICPTATENTPIETIAELNEREGCVRESYAALVAAHQGATATDPKIRKAMAAIASDELRHASLSREVRSWILPQLTGAQREHLTDVRQQELQLLRERTRTAMPEPVRMQLGLPSAATASLMIGLLASEAA